MLPSTKNQYHSHEIAKPREAVMEDKQKEMIATLYEELVIARGLIKEICDARGITEPRASIERMSKAIEKAREFMKENIR